MKKIVIVLGVLAVIMMVTLSAGCTSSSSSTTSSTSQVKVTPTVPTPFATATQTTVPTQASDTHEYDIVGTWKNEETGKTIIATSDHKINGMYSDTTTWEYVADGFYNILPPNDWGAVYISNNHLYMCSLGVYHRGSGSPNTLFGSWAYTVIKNSGNTYDEILNIYENKTAEEGAGYVGSNTISGGANHKFYEFVGSGKIGDTNSVGGKQLFSDGKYMCIQYGTGSAYTKVE